MDMHESTRLQALLGESIQLQTRLMELMNLGAEAHRQENHLLREQLTRLAGSLEQSAHALRAGGQQLGNEALQVIRQGSGPVLERNVADAVDKLEQQTARIAGKLEWVAQTAGEQARQLTRAQTVLVWKSLAVLAVGAVMLVGGASVWAWQEKQEAQRHRIDADLGRRISQADIVQCGDGLCARVDPKAPRTGDRRQYWPIRPRQ
ncbi:MAG TPA: hypothetical protein VGD42_14700 [Lysobacter sp.]